MTRLKVGATLVVDANDRPIGIFTERDLMVRVIVARAPTARPRNYHLMTKNPYVAQAGEAIDVVEREFQKRHIRHIPVVDGDGRLLAMLSLRDLLCADLEEQAHAVAALTSYIHGTSEPQL
jgi:CBS domain-containing protein